MCKKFNDNRVIRSHPSLAHFKPEHFKFHILPLSNKATAIHMPASPFDTYGVQDADMVESLISAAVTSCHRLRPG